MIMRILVDLTHPAHVHFFKQAIWKWKDRGHQVFITSREKDITIELLNSYGIEYICISKYGSGLLGLFKELIVRDYKLYKLARKFRLDILVAIGGVSVAHVGRLIGKPSIVFYDSEFAKLSNRITFPFTDVICTPSCYKEHIGNKQVRYNGYHELAYLHPNWFTPNPNILTEVGLTENDRFFVLRFVSWGAAHDIGQRGFSQEGMEKLITELQKYGRVIITSEAELPQKLKKHYFSLSPDKMHDLLYYATMYIGEGVTMASEAAVLGTPSIFVSSLDCGYIGELRDKYNLIYSFSDENEAINKIIELIRKDDLKNEWRKRREIMLKDKIDVTRWMIDFVENYPESFKDYKNKNK